MSERKCHVCDGTGVLSEKTWKEEKGYNEPRIRALWATPYARLEKAWVYDSALEKSLIKEHWVVEDVRFGECGYQEIDIGMTLTLKRGSSGVCWTFYNIGDIAEFFRRAKAPELKKLIGTPVATYWEGKEGEHTWGNSIQGIDILDDLVL